MTRERQPRCQSCRWWDRSNNFIAIGRDWGLCHFFGGTAGQRIPGGFIDFSYGHEPRGADTCNWHNASPESRADAQSDAPPIKREGETP